MSKDTFTVAYRTGGTVNCVWKRSLAFLTKEEANACAEANEKAGYKSLAFKTSQLDANGLPEGWEA